MGTRKVLRTEQRGVATEGSPTELYGSEEKSPGCPSEIRILREP